METYHDIFNQAECSILVWYRDENGARFLILALVFTVDGDPYTAVIGELILPSIKFSYLRCY